MATSPRAFLTELYEEYLEEASFLYGQRLKLFENPEIGWRKIGEFEDRLEAHIDGLVVGDKLALEICRRQAIEGDAGELYAAICIFCRGDRWDLVIDLLDRLDPGEAPKASAVADALKHELPRAWSADLVTLLGSGPAKFAPILARALGYRRVPCGPQLLAAMKRCTAAALPELVWALGRMNCAPAKERLLDYLKSEEEPVRAAAAIALARMGESGMMDHCLSEVRGHAWPILPLGLAGGRSAWAALTELAAAAGSEDCLVALGLLGDPASVPLMLSKLEQPDSAASAALALEAITGAGIYETAFVPEEIEEDESPVRGDGRPYGTAVSRLSQNTDEWGRWWHANANRFIEGVRYRNGGPYSAGRLTDMLMAEGTPKRLRGYCSEELVTRYGRDFGLETDMFAARQKAVLAEACAWSQLSGRPFGEGAWYFAGNPIQ